MLPHAGRVSFKAHPVLIVPKKEGAEGSYLYSECAFYGTKSSPRKYTPSRHGKHSLESEDGAT